METLQTPSLAMIQQIIALKNQVQQAQIQLQQQAHNDFASINAPDDVKESLFMELGLSEPTHTAPIIAPSSVHTGAESLMGNGIAIVSTLCLGALIGWYVHSLQFTEIKL